jgi:hypothetical protein
MANQSKYDTIVGASKRLGITRNTLQRWLAAGKIKYHPDPAGISKKRVVCVPEILKYWQERKEGAGRPLDVIRRLEGQPKRAETMPHKAHVDANKWISYASKLKGEIHKLIERKPLSQWDMMAKMVFAETLRPIVQIYVDAGGSLDRIKRKA